MKYKLLYAFLRHKLQLKLFCQIYCQLYIKLNIHLLALASTSLISSILILSNTPIILLSLIHHCMYNRLIFKYTNDFKCLNNTHEFALINLSPTPYRHI